MVLLGEDTGCATLGFTNDAAKKRRGRAIGFAGPHTHRHEAGAAPVDVALAGVVGHHVFAHEFVRAI